MDEHPSSRYAKPAASSRGGVHFPFQHRIASTEAASEGDRLEATVLVCSEKCGKIGTSFPKPIIRPMEQNPFTSIAEDEFAKNPEPRCASLLILDVSSSMTGDRIRELQDGLTVYKDELVGDGLARKRVEVAVVTFGGSVDIVQNFVTADAFTPPILTPNADTPMGQAVVAGLNLLDQRKQEYRNNGIGYYRPWVFLITDGGPTDINTPQWPEAISRVKAGEEAKAFSFFGVGVQDADMERLANYACANQ